MPNLKWIIILSFSTIVTSVAVYFFIRSIAEDSSSTAAIAYIFVPVLALVVFGVTTAILYALVSIRDIVVGEVPLVSLPAFFSSFVILLSIFIIWTLYSISRLSSPELSASELEKAHKKYSNSFSLTQILAESYILENPNVPSSILEELVQGGNYSAAKHPNLSTDSIDKLVRKKSLTDWGMLSTLVSHPHVGEVTLRFLAEKTSADFQNPDEWKDYCTYVLSIIVTNEKLDIEIRKNLEKNIPKVELIE